jgi:hypothetical protein
MPAHFYAGLFFGLILAAIGFIALYFERKKTKPPTRF